MHNTQADNDEKSNEARSFDFSYEQIEAYLEWKYHIKLCEMEK